MRWFGIFGPIDRGSYRHVPLDAGTVGPITVADAIYGLVPGRDAAPYWANKIQGEVTATRWSDSQTLEAASQARLIASLISLVHEPGIRTVDRPGSSADRVYSRFMKRRPQNRPRSRSGAPSIAETSWARLQNAEAKEKGVLEKALIMFHEGLLLCSEHPSMALVAFVATIEAVGKMECGFKKGVGAHRAFKSALERVGYGGERLRVADKTYGDFRCPTVHSAELFGHEATAGVQTARLHASGSHARAAAFAFPAAIGDVGPLWLLEQACKRVLLSHL